MQLVDCAGKLDVLTFYVMKEYLKEGKEELTYL
jgi:hypothetical protein